MGNYPSPVVQTQQHVVTVSFDDVLLVRLTRGDAKCAYEIASFFERNGARAVDPLVSLTFTSNKLLPYFERSGHTAVIPTLFFNTTSISLETVLSHLSFPFIVKPQHGHSGTDIFCINSAQDFERFIEETDYHYVMAHEYITDIEGECRAVVI